MLGSTLARITVPLVIVVSIRSIGHGLAPISRMKRHAVLGTNVEDRNPPIHLRERRGIPGVPMRVKCISDTRREVIRRICGAQSWNIKIGLFQVASTLCEQPADQFLRSRVVNEPGLQVSKNLYTLLNRDMILHPAGIVRVKRALDQLPCEFAQLQCARRW